jgi:hypothetical protein
MWDEMAYHWYSPAQAFFEQKWDFAPGLFNNVPRLIETVDIALFQAFRTYSVARLLNFMIYFSTIISLGNYLRSKYGVVMSFFGKITFLLFSYSTLVFSTSGYVDVFSASFLFLAILVLLSEKNILSIVALLSLALGTKYTSISPALAILLITVFVSWKRIFTKKIIVGSILVFILMGGYWYAKNTFLLKNPIYPLFFTCDDAYCYKNENFFGIWTKPIKLLNIPTIVSELSEKNIAIEILVFLAFVVILFKFNLIKSDLKLIILIFVVDWIISSYSTSFMLRYFLHWHFILIFVFLCLMATKLRIRWVFGSLLFICAVYTLLVSWSYLFKNPIEHRYALGKSDIYNWIDSHFYEMKSAIKWCDKQNTIVQTSIKDPNLIWANYEGMFRVFLVNCIVSDISKVRAPQKFYFFSLLNCGEPTVYPEHEPWHIINQNYICNAKKVNPHVFEYEIK